MKTINVFNDSELWLEKKSDENDVPIYFIVEALIEAVQENGIEIEDYL